MIRLLQPLFALLASTHDPQLRQMVEFLQQENKILRAKLPTRITVTAREKTRLVKLGTALGSKLKELITIVSPRTFARWVAATNTPKEKTGTTTEGNPTTTPKRGRPRTAEDIRELVLKLARENGWGYTRVLGELKKLGIHTVSRSTVVNILKEAGLDPGPKRGKGTWDEFVTRHAATLWAADFISVRTLTAAGIVELYLLFFIHIESRCVIVSHPTANPDSAWVTQQARNATMQMGEWGLTAKYLVIDHDAKFTATFDAVFEADGAKVQRVGPRAPNMNPFAERFVQTLRRECLDHFLILGQKHLAHITKEFLAHYHEERPHQGKGNVPLGSAEEEEPRTIEFPTGEVKCRQRLGGLLKHYYRAAA